MNLRNVSVALFASCFVASSAAAVTVTITHTGIVDYIDLGPPDFDLIYTPQPGRGINVGDTGTVTYTIDLDQTGTPEAPSVFSGGFVSSAQTGYKSSPATLSFVGSSATGFSTGPSFDLGVLDIAIGAAEGPVGSSPMFQNWYLVRSPFPTVSGAGIGFTAYDSRDTLPFQPTLADRFLPAQPISDFYLDTYIDPSSIGLAPDACQTAFCFIPLVNVETVVTYDGLPTDPTITPVPVPAPFLMLGAAMLGLVRLGRRAKV